MNIVSRVLCITAVSLSVTVSSSVAARAPDPAPSRALQIVEAVWKVQSLNFAYSGYATVYSCDALLRKVSEILQKDRRFDNELQSRVSGFQHML